MLLFTVANCDTICFTILDERECYKVAIGGVYEKIDYYDLIEIANILDIPLTKEARGELIKNHTIDLTIGEEKYLRLCKVMTKK